MCSYNNLTETEKRRFRQASVCPICGTNITQDHSICWTKYKSGRNLAYVFFHKECVERAYRVVNHQGVKNGEEEI